MRSRPGRAVFATNALVSAALVVLVAAIALVVRPPAPPGIAAFAPQAAKPITKAPPGQSSVSGRGDGGCAQGQACGRVRPSAGPSAGAGARPIPSPSARVGVPSALQCYSWPDGSVTQTFDPQSPPCIATWPGQAKGNGGRTSMGVTATEIAVAVPQRAGSDQIGKWQPFVDFLNSHFQLYGRRIVLHPVESTQLSSTTYEDPELQRADALKIVETKPFAALDYLDSTGTSTATSAALPVYTHTLAEHRVVATAGGFFSPQATTAQLAQDAPFAWSYLPTIGDLVQQTAVMTCRQLAGRRASHALAYAPVTRKFALVLPAFSAYGSAVPGLDAAMRTLAGCGIANPPVVYYTNDEQDASAISAKMVQLRSQGITTLIFLPLQYAGGAAGPMQTADRAHYDPEWVMIASQVLQAANLAVQPASQSGNTIGVTGINKLVPLQGMPWFESYMQGGGEPGSTSGTGFVSADAAYHELLLLASGAQMAGPHLTPQSFAAALQSTEFPNPGAGQSPLWQARVGFPAPGQSMVRDVAGWWLDPTTNGAAVVQEGTTQAGDDWQSLCWLDLGTRYVDGSWRRTDSYRSGPCR